jgi:hypothetical protein
MSTKLLRIIRNFPSVCPSCWTFLLLTDRMRLRYWRINKNFQLVVIKDLMVSSNLYVTRSRHRSFQDCWHLAYQKWRSVMVKHLAQSIQLLFAVSALRLSKNFTKANHLSVDSDYNRNIQNYVYYDYTVLNKTYLGRHWLKINSSKHANCQTTHQESILSSEVHASTPLSELFGNTIHRSLSSFLCEKNVSDMNF